MALSFEPQTEINETAYPMGARLPPGYIVERSSYTFGVTVRRKWFAQNRITYTVYTLSSNNSDCSAELFQI